MKAITLGGSRLIQERVGTACPDSLSVSVCRSADFPAFASGFGAVASKRSADGQSAISPICNRQSVGSVPSAVVLRRLAECNSATQQTTSLRYGLWQDAKQIRLHRRGERAGRGFTRRHGDLHSTVG